ncbi:MAG: exo-alpha-sialidase [Anaerolineae bacterium]
MTVNPDTRLINTGNTLPTSSYADQPYIVRTDDGAWLCCVTTGAGIEGAPGQIVTTMRSSDQGRTWSEPVAVEPADGPEASYAVMLKAPGGRVYLFYNHNSDNLRELRADDPPFVGGICRRVDSQGYFVFKYSDDHGKSWSARRYPIPVRAFEIDRMNAYAGAIRFFWNVGKPFCHNGAAYVSLHKVGGFGEGFFTSSEGVLLKSPNLLSEADPDKIAWETLPDGEIGLRTPPGGGPIAEEQSYVVLSDGSFFSVYRTIDGHPACSYSRDGGHTWSTPRYMAFGDGRLIKHPRAANFVWKCANGKYLYWFHNHGGRFIGEHPQRRTIAYEDRNPVWLCGGIEVDKPTGREIRWSQPEIVLYDDDPYIRISYPDLVEEDGQYYLTETQKQVARVHHIDPELLQGLWNQSEPPVLRSEVPVLALDRLALNKPSSVELPNLPDFTLRDHQRADYGTLLTRAGFTLELLLQMDALEPGQILLDNRNQQRIGFCLHTVTSGAVELVLNDGRTENRWASDPGTLQAGVVQHIVVIVDGGPHVILYVVDGHLQDGGEYRQFGWGRFSPNLRGVNSGAPLRIGGGLKGALYGLTIYGRALRVSEVVGKCNSLTANNANGR